MVFKICDITSYIIVNIKVNKNKQDTLKFTLCIVPQACQTGLTDQYVTMVIHQNKVHYTMTIWVKIKAQVIAPDRCRSGDCIIQDGFGSLIGVDLEIVLSRVVLGP